MNAEVREEVTFLKGVKEENLPKRYKRETPIIRLGTGNGIKG
jgi:hypothetical protein